MKKYSCTGCSYVYDPFVEEEDRELGTSFDDLDETWTCPHCGESKDMFDVIPESIQSVYDTRYMTDQEECHIPHYTRKNGKIYVSVGTEDNPHPTEEGHFIEYVGLFDEENDPIDIKIRPEENTVVFDDEELDHFEVLASCNIHGVWKGRKI